MSFWTTDDPVIQDRKVLRGGMFPYQRNWWELPNFVKMLVGGYGSGKTRTLVKRAIASALHNAPVPVSIVSPTFPMARKTIIPTLVELLEGKAALRGDMTFRHNHSDHSFIVKIVNRQPATILYLSGDNPDSLKGSNLAAAFIDEPFIQDVKVYEQMHARCRHPDAKLSEIGLTGTPEELNWGYELAEGDLREKSDIGVVHATTMDNKALGEDYYKRLLETYDEKTADAYVRGKFVNLAKGTVYYGFNRERNIRTVAKTPPYVHFIAGMDFNVNPMAMCAGWRDGVNLHFTHEWEMANADTEYACQVLKEALPNHRLIYPDPTGNSRHTNAAAGVTDFSIIRSKGLLVEAPHEPWARRDSLNAVNKKLSDGTLTFDPKCKKLIKYMMELTHERWNQQQSMTHLTDAMRYPVTYMFPVLRPGAGVARLVGP